jgi:hypothetical protein
MRPSTSQTPESRAKAAAPAGEIDWLALWALSLGFCAVVLAGITFFTIGDKAGASFILAAAAGIIAAALRASPPTRG